MSLIERYDALLFDLDGTLYRGDSLLPGGAEAVAGARTARKGIAFLTNNSHATPQEVAAKLSRLGVPAKAEEVVTSATATARYLGSLGGGRALVVGGAGVREALETEGIEVVQGEVANADFVVVGWDPSTDYGKLRDACLLVERGARLVATNADPAFPAADGKWPGAGALLAVVTTTTGADPVVIGKPDPGLCLMALERAGGGVPLVIGDRLDTDIAAANGLGWDSMLVLTGISRESDLRGSQWVPTYLADDLSALAADVVPVRRPREG